MTTKPYVPPDRDTEYRPDQLPPARPWYPHRPAETSADPDAATFGAVGPDMGYARALLGRFRGRLVPGGCNRDDLLEAGAAVAMRRATISGRAPVPEDLEVAFLLLGALDGVPGDWSRAGAKVAEHVDGVRYKASGAARLAASIPADWLLRKPGGVRAQLLQIGPDVLYDAVAGH
ncbi:MAG: hypothetical protein U0U69_09125 [Acidimicrobiia bacterium]